MTFEGEHKVIPIKGIARAGADSICEDGAMNEVVGFEYKDGSYVPYAGVETRCTLLHGTDKLRLHKTSNGNNVIAFVKDGQNESVLWMKEEHFLEGSGDDICSWEVLHEGAITEIEFSKNIVILLDATGKNLYYMFNTTEYKKISIDVIRQLLPIANIYATNDTPIEINNKNNGPILSILNIDNMNLGQVGIDGAYLKGISKLTELGRLHGYVLATCAYKLVSGEYLYASAPILLCPPNDAVGKTSDYENQYENWKYYTPFYRVNEYDNLVHYTETELLETFDNGEFASASPQMTVFNYWQYGLLKKEKEVNAINNLPPLHGNIFYANFDSGNTSRRVMLSFASNTLKCKLSKNIDQSLKGLVDSLCIFISEQVPLYNITEDTSHQTQEFYGANSNNNPATSYPIKGFYFDKRKEEDIIEDIKNIRGLYLVDEIPFSEIIQGDVDIDLRGKLGENLALQTLLPISAFTNKEIVGGTPYVYNSRNHIFNYSEKYVYGFDINQLKLVGGNGQLNYASDDEYGYQVMAKIDSLQLGSYIVVSEVKAAKISLFNGYITYPDSAATEVYIIRDDGLEMYFKMTPAKSGGYSYCLSSLDQIDFKNDAQYGYFRTPASPTFNQGNQIKVSEVYFSYSFPSQNTYTLGNGEIIGLASLSVPLSQDTFGSYPLLVFCTDGVYSMGVDTTGAGVYTSVPPPFSHEVCINRNTICEIDGAVLFASNKGLMMATSQGVQEFVPNLNGMPKHTPNDTKECGLGLKIYKDIVTNSNCVELVEETDGEISDYCAISIEDFKDFLLLKDTHVSYVSEKNKVVVYNLNNEYSYWIDIQTRNVTKLPIGIRTDNRNYPSELYISQDDKVIEFRHESSGRNVNCLLQSRPIKLAAGFKGSTRVIARGYFNSATTNNYIVMLVLGSYDAINWQPIGYNQRKVLGGFTDIGCNTDRVSYKYMMVIVAGQLRPTSHIDGIELTMKNKYNNKLK